MITWTNYGLFFDYKDYIYTTIYVTETNSQIKMSAISMLNPKAEVARAAQALAVNISGAKVGFVLLLSVNKNASSN